MMFNVEEKRLVILYHSGSASMTAAVVKDALNDIIDPDERINAANLLRKLTDISESDFRLIDPEMGCIYV